MVSTCNRCGRQILADLKSANNKHYHLQCYTCAICDKIMDCESDLETSNIAFNLKEIYCQKCFREFFGEDPEVGELLKITDPPEHSGTGTTPSLVSIAIPKEKESPQVFQPTDSMDALVHQLLVVPDDNDELSFLNTAPINKLEDYNSNALNTPNGETSLGNGKPPLALKQASESLDKISRTPSKQLPSRIPRWRSTSKLHDSNQDIRNLDSDTTIGNSVTSNQCLTRSQSHYEIQEDINLRSCKSVKFANPIISAHRLPDQKKSTLQIGPGPPSSLARRPPSAPSPSRQLDSSKPLPKKFEKKETCFQKLTRYFMPQHKSSASSLTQRSSTSSLAQQGLCKTFCTRPRSNPSEANPNAKRYLLPEDILNDVVPQGRPPPSPSSKPSTANSNFGVFGSSLASDYSSTGYITSDEEEPVVPTEKQERRHQKRESDEEKMVTKKDSSKGLLDCPICLKKLVDTRSGLSGPEDRENVVTSCGHIFHKDCITVWLDTQTGTSDQLKCPICSKPCEKEKLTPIYIESNFVDKVNAKTENEELRALIGCLRTDYKNLCDKFQALLQKYNDSETRVAITDSLKTAYEIECRTRSELQWENKRLRQRLEAAAATCLSREDSICESWTGSTNNNCPNTVKSKMELLLEELELENEEN